jgi:hypothetical protein
VRNVGLLTLFVITSVPWVAAQEGAPGRDVWIPANTYPTLQGCLQSSSLRYIVVGQDGTVYNLTGETVTLRSFVGYEVEVGKPTVVSFSTTEENMASTVEEIPALGVKSVKELSKTCSSGPRPD